jgi:DNA-binding response OmpR family regulator
MNDLTGLRAFLVEDEGGIALLIEDMLVDLGCELAGSAARLDRACDMARNATADFAVLDVNLDGQPVFPLARILRERKIPFVFSTGYGATGMPPEFNGAPVLTKPFVLEQLRRAILAALTPPSGLSSRVSVEQTGVRLRERDDETA